MKTEAMPRIIDPLPTNLLSDSESHLLYTKCKKLPVIEHPYDGADLVYDNRAYYVLDNSLQKVPYLMKWNTRKVLNIEMAYQIIVWSDPTVPNIKGYSYKVFFDQLFSRFQAICTDRSQTEHGKRFWYSSIAKALEEGYHIYTVNLNNTPVIYGVIDSVSKLKDYDAKGFVWDDDRSGEGKLLIISKNQISKFHKGI